MFGHSYPKAGLCCVSVCNFWRHFERGGGGGVGSSRSTINTNCSNNNNSQTGGSSGVGGSRQHSTITALTVLNELVRSFDTVRTVVTCCVLAGNVSLNILVDKMVIFVRVHVYVHVVLFPIQPCSYVIIIACICTLLLCVRVIY